MDKLLAQRPMVGMCGADAHAAVKLGHGRILRFPGYATVFLVGREHVLLAPSGGRGRPQPRSAAEILDALRHGHAFCALDALYPAGGFVAQVTSGGVSGGPGDFVNLANTGAKAGASAGSIHVAVPPGAGRPLIKVMRDGQELIEKRRLDAGRGRSLARAPTARKCIYGQPGFAGLGPLGSMDLLESHLREIPPPAGRCSLQLRSCISPAPICLTLREWARCLLVSASQRSDFLDSQPA